MAENTVDVVVVGAGNAALCAALAAREAGVLVLERAPQDERGGNSAFTAGAVRVAYNTVEDLYALMPDLSDEEKHTTDFGTYSEDQFFDDMARVTQHRANPDLVEILVRRSHETVKWLTGKGVRFVPMYARQAFKIDGKFKFWGGLTIEAWGGGPGLVEAEHAIASKQGIEIRYGARVTELLADEAGVHGVRVRRGGKVEDIRARAVVLASGGFEANSEWRTRYLGPGWDLAKVRGSRFNTGDGIRMAMDIGAQPYGNWSGCHAVGWDRNAPEFGDLAVGDGYRIRQVTKVQADTLEELVAKLDDVDPQAALAELKAYNAAVDQSTPFNPTVKDGRGTQGLAVAKTNWANTLDKPPFLAFAVTCGITFTFGGLRITNEGQVIDTDGEAIPGLFAAGELVGGLFYFNYPGGTGLLSGAVFGRIAGGSAASAAQGSNR